MHGFAIMKDTQHHHYGDYLTWTDDRRYELIDGIAYAMSPAPDLAHQDVDILTQHGWCFLRAGKGSHGIRSPIRFVQVINL